MNNNTIKILASILFIFALNINHSFAASYAYADEEVTDGDILAEWLVRPVGMIGTVAGFATFIVGLPFSVTSDSTEESYEKLVKDPFEYTFHRPVGHYSRDKNY